MILWVLKLLPWLGRLSPILKGNWKAISFVLTAVAIASTYLWIGHLNKVIDELESQAVLYQQANKENVATIETLEGANKSLAEAVRITDEVRDAAEEKARERASQAASELSDTISELEDLRNANPTCEQLSDLDVGAACPLVVERMRRASDN